MTKQDEPEKGLDVEAYIAGMVQAAEPKMQANQPAWPLTPKEPRRSPSNQFSNRQRTAPRDGVQQCAHSRSQGGRTCHSWTKDGMLVEQ